MTTWQKIKIWTKLVIIGLASLAVLIFVAANGNHDAKVWLWTDHTFNVLELMAGSFLFGVLVTLLAKPIYHTLGQIQLLTAKPADPLPMAPSPISAPPSISNDPIPLDAPADPAPASSQP